MNTKQSTSRIVAGRIESKIYFIRGTRVMLDADLAGLYGVRTAVLNQAVQRNRDRFPDDFMFQLKQSEVYSLRSQIVTSKVVGRGGRRYAPFAFTEQGIAMLSSVLHSARAVQVNIAIMRAFVQLRAMLATHEDLRRKIDEMEKRYDSQFHAVFATLRQMFRDAHSAQAADRISHAPGAGPTAEPNGRFARNKQKLKALFIHKVAPKR